MPSSDFDAAVDRVLLKDSRFDRNAYFFLREALDFTVGEAQKGKGSKDPKSRHVRGQQLLEGLRRYALGQFGPMVPTVFDYWGIKKCEHIGDMVYSLIEAGYFAKSEQDSPEDFRGGYSFHEAFVSPFQPSSARSAPPRPSRARSKAPRKAPSGGAAQNTESSQSAAGPEN